MSLIQPERFDAKFINKTFYTKEWKYGLLSSINTGRCYDWAYKAFCLWSDVQLWTTERHAWVQCGDKFYDSESWKGVPSLDEIPCNKRTGWDEVPPTAMDSKEFQEFWNDNGGGERFHWHLLVERIKSVGLSVLRT